MGFFRLRSLQEKMLSQGPISNQFTSRSETTRTDRTFIGILLLLFSISCLKHFCTFATGPTLLEYDAVEYWERGGRVAEGDLLQVRDAVNYRGPLYPWIIGICRWLWPSHALMLLSVVQHILSLASEWLAARMCWEVLRTRRAFLIGYAIAVAGITSPWFANVVLTEILFQFIFTCCVWMLVRYHREPKISTAMGFGGFLALSVLTRPIPKLLWIPMLLLYFCHCTSRMTNNPISSKRIAMHAIASLLSMYVVMLPWTVRNHFYFDDSSVAKVPPINKWVVCFHAGAGGELVIPRSDAGDKLRSYLPDIDDNADLRQDGYGVLRRLSQVGISERQIDDLVSHVCWDAILENPNQFLWKSFKRFGNFWRCRVKEYPFYSTYPSAEERLPQAYPGQSSWRLESIAKWYECILRNSLFTHVRFIEFYSLTCMIGLVILFYRLETRIVALAIFGIFAYFAAVTAALEIENYRYRAVLEPSIALAITGAIGRARRFRVQ